MVPPGSVEDVHDRLTCAADKAFAFRFVGAVGMGAPPVVTEAVVE
jgi:hypothetical protein